MSPALRKDFMPYSDHLELPPAPAGDAVIWRYLPLAEFLNLLNEQTLHFTRIDRLSDSFPDVEKQVTLNAFAGISAESTRRSLSLMKNVQSAVFTNSWYENDSDAHRCWEIHGDNREVAIRTTVGTLKKSLFSSSPKIYLSSVQYIDFASVPMPTGNLFLSALYKPHELWEQKEIRMLLLQTGGDAAFSPGPEQGVDVNIVAGSLIQGIRVTPQSDHWFRSLVNSVADRLNLNFEDSTSESKSPCKLRTSIDASIPSRPDPSNSSLSSTSHHNHAPNERELYE